MKHITLIALLGLSACHADTKAGLAKATFCERFTSDMLHDKINDGEDNYLQFQWCAGYLGAFYGSHR